MHVKLLVAGRVIRKELEAEPGLVWRYAWDRRNVYNQKVNNIILVKISLSTVVTAVPRCTA